ncbi:hypothetical protein [Streptomyces sp. NPDC059979]|uniref:hypothetical protein n=1 Tax=Streptomyces sp. NPDC059979 TaxID=3347021 RepID=UPI0036A89066
MEVPGLHSPVETAAVQAMAARLQDLEWSRVNSIEPVLAIERPHGIVYQIALNPQVKSDRVIFHPHLGLMHLETSGLVAAFANRQFRGLAGACSMGAGLSDLLYDEGVAMAPYTRWTVRSEEGAVREIDALWSDLQDYGFPYLNSVESLRDLIERMDSAPKYQELSGHLAVACALEGLQAEALDALGEYAAKAHGQQGDILNRSRSFVSSFVSHFRIGESILEYPMGS